MPENDAEVHVLRITRVVGWALPLLYTGLGASTALADEPTQRYGYCAVSAHVPPAGTFQVYFSANFATQWPVIVSLESRFQSFVESKYGVQISRYAECVTYATMADAQKYRAEHWPPVPGHPYVETGWAPAPATQESVPPAQALPPAAPPNASAPLPASPAASTAAAPHSATYVICKSDFNTDLQRFYNPPVDGRGAAYADWQASYQTYLERTYHHTSTNLSCSKYSTRTAAQADYDSWLTDARASPTVNGQPSPITITNWTY